MWTSSDSGLQFGLLAIIDILVGLLIYTYIDARSHLIAFGTRDFASELAALVAELVAAFASTSLGRLKVTLWQLLVDDSYWLA